MKKTKLLIIGLIVVLSTFLSSCDKEDLSIHSLNNTHWVTEFDEESDYNYSLSFNNGYVQKIRLNNQTGQVKSLEYTAKYELKGEKLIIYVPMGPYEINTYEGKYEKGIIYVGGDKYYLQ